MKQEQQRKGNTFTDKDNNNDKIIIASIYEINTYIYKYKDKLNTLEI